MDAAVFVILILLGLDYSSRNEIYLDSADNESNWATMFLIGMHAKDEVTINASIRRNRIVRTRDRTSIAFGMNADVNNRLVLIVPVTLLLPTTKKILYAG